MHIFLYYCAFSGFIINLKYCINITFTRPNYFGLILDSNINQGSVFARLPGRRVAESNISVNIGLHINAN